MDDSIIRMYTPKCTNGVVLHIIILNTNVDGSYFSVNLDTNLASVDFAISHFLPDVTVDFGVLDALQTVE